MSQWKVFDEVDHYFVTTTIVNWQYVFTSQRYFDIIIEALKYCMVHKGLHLHAYVLMLNHAHYIVSADPSMRLPGIMRDLNTHVSRKITDQLRTDGRRDILRIFQSEAQIDGRGNRYKVWQEGYHPIAVFSDSFFLQKMNYIHDNPVRKGYVDDPVHWRYSSARNYFNGDHSVIEVECGL